MPDPTHLLLVANARLPSQRAQSLQVAQAANAFARAGVPTTLCHAWRRDTPVRTASELWDHYAIGDEPHADVHAVRCVDWIDLVPRALQYLPARLQELSFAKNAARECRRAEAGTWVVARELECALRLVREGRSAVFLEAHRVPGGKLRRRWLEEAAPSLAGVIAISGGVRDDLVTLGVDPSSILVEHDAYDPARFESLPEQSAARRELELAREATIVTYTGGLLEWKGVDLLVDAARLLPELYFVIAGGMNADVAALRARAEGLANVRIDGFQPPDRVPLYLAAADLGVVPNRSTPAISARYTSPLKVFEAMATGLPLVASDLPSLRELLTHGEDAWLVPPDDAAALAEGIRTLAGDEALRARLAEHIARRAEGATWDARAARLLAWMGTRV